MNSNEINYYGNINSHNVGDPKTKKGTIVLTSDTNTIDSTESEEACLVIEQKTQNWILFPYNSKTNPFKTAEESNTIVNLWVSEINALIE
jgi:hypothetical protein